MIHSDTQVVGEDNFRDSNTSPGLEIAGFQNSRTFPGLYFINHVDVTEVIWNKKQLDNHIFKYK